MRKGIRYFLIVATSMLTIGIKAMNAREGDDPVCAEHGVESDQTVLSGKAIEAIAKFNNVQADAVNGIADLGYVCVGQTIRIVVTARDEDNHVCEWWGTKTIWNTVTSDEVKAEAFSVAGDGTEVSLGAPIVLEKGAESQGETPWSGSLAVQDGWAGKKVLIRLSGLVSDKLCGYKAHAGADDSSDLDLGAFYAKLKPFKVVGIDVVPKDIPEWFELPEPVSIGVGGVASGAHQADVTVHVVPADAGVPVGVSLLNGLGHVIEKDARLVLEGIEITTAGGARTVQTSADGKLAGVLTSSDVVEISTIKAENMNRQVAFGWAKDERQEPYLDTDGDGQYTMGESFTDLDGDGAWTGAQWVSDPNIPIIPGQSMQTVRLRHYRAGANAENPWLVDPYWKPLNGHHIAFFVEEVQFTDENGNVQSRSNPPDSGVDLSEWAFFPDAEYITNPDGIVTAPLMINDRPNIVLIRMAAYDLDARRSVRQVATVNSLRLGQNRINAAAGDLRSDCATADGRSPTALVELLCYDASRSVDADMVPEAKEEKPGVVVLPDLAGVTCAKLTFKAAPSQFFNRRLIFRGQFANGSQMADMVTIKYEAAFTRVWTDVVFAPVPEQEGQFYGIFNRQADAQVDFKVYQKQPWAASDKVYVSAQISDSRNNKIGEADSATLVGMKVEFKEKSFDADNFGWDDYTMTWNAAVTCPLKSVAVGESDQVVVDVKPSDLAASLTFESSLPSRATVSESLPVSGEVTITGRATGPCTVKALRNGAETDARIKVYVYAKKELNNQKKISITLVDEKPSTRPNDTGYQGADVSEPDAKAAINKVFKQAVVFFSVTKTAPHPVDFDINNDEQLDVTTYRTPEQELIIQECDDPQFDVNIFLAAKPSDKSTCGLTRIGDRFVFMFLDYGKPRHIPHEIVHTQGLDHYALQPNDQENSMFKWGYNPLSWRLRHDQWDRLNPSMPGGQ